MQLDYISSPDITYKIFRDHLNLEAQEKFAQVSKKIRHVVGEKWLLDLKIDRDESLLSPYSQVMKHYREYCEYFWKKLPETFQKDVFQGKGNTVLTIKKVIDAKLLLAGTRKDTSLLNEVWDAFVDGFSPECGRYRPCNPINQPIVKISNTRYYDAKKELEILLEAGARPHSLVLLLKESWCTLKTVNLLLDKDVYVSPVSIFRAVDRFEPVLERMFKALDPDDYSFRLLLEGLPSSYESKLEFYLNKLNSVSAYNMRLALEKKYSEEFIRKALSKCKEDLDEYHVRLALQNSQSENLVLELLSKCPEGADEYHVRLAIERDCYSNECITKLVLKMHPENEKCKFTYHNISKALQKKCPEDLLELMMSKVMKSDLCESIDCLVKACSYPKMVEKWILDASGLFQPTVFRSFEMHGYSEAVFMKIFSMTNPKESIHEISLSKVIEFYSSKAAEILIKNGIKVYVSDLDQALEKDYPGELISKFLDRLDSVASNSIKIAKQKKYDPEIIQKMQSKCSESESCSLM